MGESAVNSRHFRRAAHPAQGRSLNDLFKRLQPRDPCSSLLARDEVRPELPRMPRELWPISRARLMNRDLDILVVLCKASDLIVHCEKTRCLPPFRRATTV
jgi:hypothetical protein